MQVSCGRAGSCVKGGPVLSASTQQTSTIFTAWTHLHMDTSSHGHIFTPVCATAVQLLRVENCAYKDAHRVRCSRVWWQGLWRPAQWQWAAEGLLQCACGGSPHTPATPVARQAQLGTKLWLRAQQVVAAGVHASLEGATQGLTSRGASHRAFPGGRHIGPSLVGVTQGRAKRTRVRPRWRARPWQPRPQRPRASSPGHQCR
jgi:hypothetical protein